MSHCPLPIIGCLFFLVIFGGIPGNLDEFLSFSFPIPTEISANHSVDRSGDSGERRKHLKAEECGFLPKAATPVLQRSLSGLKSGFYSASRHKFF
jgi:hypothetical protein